MKNKRRQIRLWPIIIVFGLLISGFGLKSVEANGTALMENRGVYSQDKAGSVVYLYVTVLKGFDKKTGKAVTFKDVNQYVIGTTTGKSETDVVLQEGTPAGPGTSVSWQGTIAMRGKSTTEAKQKSYKIKLDKSSGAWHSQSTLNLNKHPFDLTRVRNKLSMDYFATIPHFAGLRTQFVNLWVKDMSAETAANSKYVDYGLYTHVEQPNENYLKTHGFDPKGQLYKAEFFEFLRYADQLKIKDESGYDRKKFEAILEIKGSDDHQKLIAMLEDVNNSNNNFDEVMARHFNLENLMTWLAINILVQNYDTNSQNFFLYSPSNSETWYFLPWDYDVAWGFPDQAGVHVDYVSKWQQGVANYWGMPLFKRMFHNPKYLKLLTEKIESVARIMNKAQTMEFLNNYRPAVAPFVKRLPDLDELPYNVDTYDAEFNRLANVIEENRQAFYKNLENPMPYFLADPEMASNKLEFRWDASFDLQGDALSYSFELASDPGFTKILVKAKLSGTSYTMSKPKAGTYYYRVIVHDSKGHSQVAFDTFFDQKGKQYFGIKEFVVK